MEDIVNALETIADALSKPNQGHCIVLFEQTDKTVGFAVIRFGPSGFGSFQKYPPIFYAVLAKEFDKPCQIFLLTAKMDSDAIREGIKFIDSYDDYMTDQAVYEHDRLINEMEAIQPGDPIPY